MENCDSGGPANRRRASEGARGRSLPWSRSLAFEGVANGDFGGAANRRPASEGARGRSLPLSRSLAIEAMANSGDAATHRGIWWSLPRLLCPPLSPSTEEVADEPAASSSHMSTLPRQFLRTPELMAPPLPSPPLSSRTVVASHPLPSPPLLSPITSPPLPSPLMDSGTARRASERARALGLLLSLMEEEALRAATRDVSMCSELSPRLPSPALSPGTEEVADDPAASGRLPQPRQFLGTPESMAPPVPSPPLSSRAPPLPPPAGRFQLKEEITDVLDKEEDTAQECTYSNISYEEFYHPQGPWWEALTAPHTGLAEEEEEDQLISDGQLMEVAALRLADIIAQFELTNPHVAPVDAMPDGVIPDFGAPPARRDTILNLPIIPSNNKDEQQACAICKENLGCSSTTILHCKHYFHLDCIVPWLLRRNTCPVCRYKLPTDSVE